METISKLVCSYTNINIYLTLSTLGDIMETLEDFKKGDQFQSQWESNFDDARDECMTEADNIIMEVEHMVDDVTEKVAVQDVLTLAYAINKVVNLRYFRLSATVYGKYKEYEEDFDYDFTNDIKMVLQDRLFFDIKLGGK